MRAQAGPVGENFGAENATAFGFQCKMPVPEVSATFVQIE